MDCTYARLAVAAVVVLAPLLRKAPDIARYRAGLGSGAVEEVCSPHDCCTRPQTAIVVAG